MEKILKNFFIVALGILLAGCAEIKDIPKVIWGSSTLALEKARTNAIRQTFHCRFEECFDAVVSLEYKVKSKELLSDGVFDIFIKDRKKGYLVVMGIQGSERATEVGIFFIKVNPQSVKIEISSLSHIAKEKAAESIFTALASKFAKNKSTP